MQYELYHDESKENGYWHGMLLVPVNQKRILVEYLKQARNNTSYQHPIGIKKVKRKGRVFNCAGAWIHIGVASLISKQQGLPLPISTGELLHGKKQYNKFNHLIGAKFIVFRETDNHLKMENHTDYGSKVETTFRMGLKGGLHFLGDKQHTIEIVKMHFDGHEHYARHLDKSRIVDRLSGLREYCSISDVEDLIDDRTSNHQQKERQLYEDCQLLQLTDLLVGSFRTILGEATREIHLSLASPVKRIIERYQQGYARMRNSRWNNSFCISQCSLVDGTWQFSTIQYEKNTSSHQPTLFS